MNGPIEEWTGSTIVCEVWCCLLVFSSTMSQSFPIEETPVEKIYSNRVSEFVFR